MSAYSLTHVLAEVETQGGDDSHPRRVHGQHRRVTGNRKTKAAIVIRQDIRTRDVADCDHWTQMELVVGRQRLIGADRPCDHVDTVSLVRAVRENNADTEQVVGAMSDADANAMAALVPDPRKPPRVFARGGTFFSDHQGSVRLV
jgi:hypothetical protein